MALVLRVVSFRHVVEVIPTAGYVCLVGGVESADLFELADEVTEKEALVSGLLVRSAFQKVGQIETPGRRAAEMQADQKGLPTAAVRPAESTAGPRLVSQAT